MSGQDDENDGPADGEGKCGTRAAGDPASSKAEPCQPADVGPETPPTPEPVAEAGAPPRLVGRVSPILDPSRLSGVERILAEQDWLPRFERSMGLGTIRAVDQLKLGSSYSLAQAMKSANLGSFGAGSLDSITRAASAYDALKAAGGFDTIGQRHEELQRSMTMLGGFHDIFNRHKVMQKAIDAAGGLGSVASRHAAMASKISAGLLASAYATSPVEKATLAAMRDNDSAMRRIAGVTAFTGLLRRDRLTAGTVDAMISDTQEWQKAVGSVSLAARLQKTLPDLFPTLRRAQASDFAHYALPTFAERFVRDGDRMARLRDQMLRIRQPWVDADDPARSVAGYIEAKAMASAVTSAPPESRAVVAAVRAELGDYRDSEPVPDLVAGDPLLRAGLRLDIGFNSDLSSLPPAIIAAIFADFGGGVPRNVEADPDALEIVVHQRARRAELKLRRFIEQRMQAAYGPYWYKQNVPDEARREWRRRRQVDLDNGRKPSRLFDYAGFEDYRTIIENAANWTNVFEPVFKVKTSILESLRRLSLIRNPDAHIRVVTIEDFIDLWSESRRIDRWLGNAL